MRTELPSFEEKLKSRRHSFVKWVDPESMHLTLKFLGNVAVDSLTIVVPQFVPRRRWHNLLHAQTATFLCLALMFRRGIVITSVPYHVGVERDSDRSES